MYRREYEGRMMKQGWIALMERNDYVNFLSKTLGNLGEHMPQNHTSKKKTAGTAATAHHAVSTMFKGFLEFFYSRCIDRLV
jgi:hypothetical protein